MYDKSLQHDKTNFVQSLNYFGNCHSATQKVDDEKILWDKINILDKSKNYQSIENLLVDFLSAYPDSLDAFFKLARIYQKQNKNEKAREIYHECIKGDNRKVYSTRMLGELCLAEKNFTESEKLFKKCIEMDPKEFLSWVNLGITYNHMNRNSEAISTFEHSLSIKKDAVWPRLELGKLYAFQNKLHEAEKWFRECLDNDHVNISARVYLSRIYIAYNSINVAEQYIKECRELFSNDKKVILVEKEIDALKNYDINRRFSHIKKHQDDNIYRKVHGVFNGDAEIIVKNAWENRKNVKPIENIEVKIYNIPFPNAGYQGGMNGSRMRLDSVSIITVGTDEKLITAFPSDGCTKQFFSES